MGWSLNQLSGRSAHITGLACVPGVSARATICIPAITVASFSAVPATGPQAAQAPCARRAGDGVGWVQHWRYRRLSNVDGDGWSTLAAATAAPATATGASAPTAAALVGQAIWSAVSTGTAVAAWAAILAVATRAAGACIHRGSTNQKRGLKGINPKRPATEAPYLRARRATRAFTTASPTPTCRRRRTVAAAASTAAAGCASYTCGSNRARVSTPCVARYRHCRVLSAIPTGCMNFRASRSGEPPGSGIPSEAAITAAVSAGAPRPVTTHSGRAWVATRHTDSEQPRSPTSPAVPTTAVTRSSSTAI